MNKIAITTGDPNGIGAEITIKALNNMNLDENKIVLISNKKVLNFYVQGKRTPATWLSEGASLHRLSNPAGSDRGIS